MSGPNALAESSPDETGLVVEANHADQPDEYVAKKHGWAFWAAVVWLGFIVICIFGSQWIPGIPGSEERVGDPRLGPGVGHWMGTNNLGRDIFALAIYGARRSMGIAIVATTVGGFVGGTVGLLAGFYRKGIDAFLTSSINIMLAVPGLVLALALVGFFAPSGGFEKQRFLFFEVAPGTNATIWATIALSILTAPSIARVARAQTMVWSDREFVLASRTIGTRNMRIITRDVLPNVLPAMTSFALIGIAALIVVEAALAFFGVGDVTGVSWGISINNGRGDLNRSPWMVLFPAVFMFLTILSLNFLADRLRDLSDVREAGI